MPAVLSAVAPCPQQGHFARQAPRGLCHPPGLILFASKMSYAIPSLWTSLALVVLRFAPCFSPSRLRCLVPFYVWLPKNVWFCPCRPLGKNTPCAIPGSNGARLYLLFRVFTHRYHLLLSPRHLFSTYCSHHNHYHTTLRLSRCRSVCILYGVPRLTCLRTMAHDAACC